MYYASFGILSLILHVIINYDLVLLKRDRKMPLAEIRYKHFLYGVTIYYISDILWGILYSFHIRYFVYADTVLYFMAMTLSVLLWTRYVVEYLDSRNIFSMVLIYAGWLIFIYEIANLVFNFFVPVVFTFSEDVVYEPKSARYITLGIQIALFFATAVYTFIMAIRTEGMAKRHNRAICLSGVVMTIFIILQTMYSLYPFYAVGCLIATCIVNTFVKADEKTEREMELYKAKEMAYTDSLTGVKNSHAYVKAKQRIDQRINDGLLKKFGVIVFDLNELKFINDTLGHEAGDNYIKKACSVICDTFKHSDVYRIGGDEFVAFLEGDDYNNRITLFNSFEKEMEDNLKEGQVVISCGFSEYIPHKDYDYNTVFRRADRKMYERKNELKDMGVNKDLLL